MHRASRPDRTVAIIGALAVLVIATVLSGCAAPAPTEPAVSTSTPTVTGTVTPTSTPVEVPEASSGPITTPASGSAERTAILAAASEGLGLSGKITVVQLFSQGTCAVGDIVPATGSRMFFAVTGGPDAWSIAWSAPFGSTLASVKSLESAAPLVSPELAAKIVWNKKYVKPVSATPSLASFEAFAMKSAKSMAGSTYTGTFTITAKIAKSANGTWWGNALAEPSVEGLEPIGVWGQFVSGKWKGQIADYATDGADADFFPADVLPKLAL